MSQARRYIVNVWISAVIACVTAKRPAFMAELIPLNITVYNETQFPSRNQLSNMEIIYICFCYVNITVTIYDHRHLRLYRKTVIITQTFLNNINSNHISFIEFTVTYEMQSS